MIKAKDQETKNWGKAIKNFSVAYETLMTEYANKVNNLLLESSYQEKIAALKTATEERRKELHRKHPCLQFRTQFRGHENHLAEVVVNEKFLQALGYTMEAFATAVLNEGLPQLIPLNFETNSRFAQNTLEKCLRKETTGADAGDFQSPEFEAIVLTKCGYVKTVKIQVHILMTHESTEYGSFTFFVLTDQGPPYLKPQEEQPLQVNQEFMDIMLTREQEAINFLSAYYDYSGSLLYTNLHRVCRVKELESSV